MGDEEPVSVSIDEVQSQQTYHQLLETDVVVTDEKQTIPQLESESKSIEATDKDRKEVPDQTNEDSGKPSTAIETTDIIGDTLVASPSHPDGSKIDNVSETSASAVAPVDLTKVDEVKSQPEEASSTVTTEMETLKAPQETVVEETPELVKDTPALKGKRKRLTLQERLALAAKGPKVTSSTDTTPSISRATSPQPTETVTIVQASAEELTEALQPLSAEVSIEQPQRNDQKRLSTEIELDKYILKEEHESEILKLRKNVQDLKSKNQVLSDAVDRFRSLQAQNNDDNDKFKSKLAEKDGTIKQLMDEGEILSRKELKLNDTIKKLRSQMKEVEEANKGLLEKKAKLDLIDGILTSNGVKSVSELAEKCSEYHSKALQLDEYIGREKANEFIIQERNDAQKKMSELNIQLELFKKQSRLEIDSKDVLINQLRQENSKNKREKNSEIQRLEEKIEALRLEAESSSNGHSRTARTSTTSLSLLNNNNINSTDVDEARSSKLVDYEDYIKLSNSHHSLQAQYLQSQETWKLLESNLSGRVDKLSQTAESYRKTNAKVTNEFKKLEHELQAKLSEFDTLKFEAKSQLDTIEKLKFKLQLKQTDIEELEAKFENFKTIYNIDREKLSLKIESLSKKLEKKELELTELATQTMTTVPSSFNASLPNLPLSTRSSQADINAWQDSIGLGESSSSPVVERSPSYERTPSYGLTHIRSHVSSVLLGPADSIEEDFEAKFSTSDNENDTINGSNSFVNVVKPRHANSSNNSISNIPSHTNLGSQHILMLNKMGSSIRRFEVELATLKEENSQLINEKENIQKELLNKFKLTDEIDNLKKEIDLLQGKIQEKDKSEKTMLEVIGEKSEQVDELTGDLKDLKDLLKVQVQQYIELQDKITKA